MEADGVGVGVALTAAEAEDVRWVAVELIDPVCFKTARRRYEGRGGVGDGEKKGEMV